jgi:hypothetical protein
MEPIEMTEEGGRGGDQAIPSFVFDGSIIPGYSNAEMLAGSEDEERFLELLGQDLVTRALVQIDKLCVYHETAKIVNGIDVLVDGGLAAM